MKDKRNEILAKNLINYSIALKKGEKIMIEIKGIEALELGKELIREAARVGAIPLWFYNDESLQRPWLLEAGTDQMEAFGKWHLRIMKECDAYIGVRGSNNPYDLADIDSDQMTLYKNMYYRPVHLEYRVKKTRWCVMRFPNNAMAQLAETSQEAFEKFYYDVCCLDYAKMSKAMDPLARLMKKTDKVHIKGPDTDLQFSIKNIGIIKCDGKRNIPDGEVYTAPVRNSINGAIKYNTVSLYEGFNFKGIRFEFKNGKIVKATCDAGMTEKLNKILDIDPGARHIGEFAIGLNPFIRHPMLDTLFDEKIAGSFHLTPGQCYDEAPNGNNSGIHWDLVMIQRKDYGGGEIWFDGKLIRKDGKFTDAKMEKSFSATALKGR